MTSSVGDMIPHDGRIELDNGSMWLIDKPAGMTSHDVINHVRRISGEKRVGHAGTLDPMATGLLVVAVGRGATRLLAEGLSGSKQYLADVKFGLASDSWDAEGQWMREVSVPRFEIQDIQSALKLVADTPSQKPPMVSALKRHGYPLHRLARKGWWLEREAREVIIESATLRDWIPDHSTATIEVACGGGFYVRSFVHDVGAALGVPAALTALRRLGVGSFHVDDAITLEEFKIRMQ